MTWIFFLFHDLLGLSFHFVHAFPSARDLGSGNLASGWLMCERTSVGFAPSQQYVFVLCCARALLF